MESEEPTNMKVKKDHKWKWNYLQFERDDLQYCFDHQYESEEFITMLVVFFKVL